MPRKKNIVPPFSKAVAEELIKKRKYTAKRVTQLVNAISESPDSTISSNWVLRQRKKMGIKATGAKGLRSRRIDEVTERMVRNLVWATNYRQKRISQIMKSIGRPVSTTFIVKIMRQERFYNPPLPESIKRKRTAVELSARFKKMPEKKGVARWLELQNQKRTLKAKIAAIGPTGVHSPTIKKIRKRQLLNQLSDVDLELEILFPLLPKSFANELIGKDSDMLIAAGLKKLIEPAPGK